MKRFLCTLLALLLLNTNALALTYYKHGDRDRKKIAISVDDFFNKSLIPEMLDIAHNNNCKLTMFILGRTLTDKDRPWLKTALDYGFEIGNHSNNHKNMSNWEQEKITKELGFFERRLNTALGFEYKPNLLRWPYGQSNSGNKYRHYHKGAEEAGYFHAVTWDVTLDDTDEMLKKIQNGSIVLFHVNKKDINVLKQLLPKLNEKGFEMVTIFELLGLEPVKYTVDK